MREIPAQRYCEVRNSPEWQRDHLAHNPKVGGSNPPPATKRHADQARSTGPGLLHSGVRAPARAGIGQACSADRRD